MAKILAFLTILFVPMLGYSFECPSGSEVVSEKASHGGHSKFCLSDGVRSGSYADWASDGRQVIWGNFESNLEHGVWTMNLGEPGNPKVVFVLFERGNDITETALKNLPPSCAAWNKMGNVERTGVLATLSLFSIDELTGAPAELATDRPTVAVCLAERARAEKYTSDGSCADNDAFTESLRKKVVEIAGTCLLEQKTGQ
jgi:hypothetical protein